jgi:hypothetical protein
MADRAEVTDELTTLVVTEKRGFDAISGLTMIMGGAGAFWALRMFPMIGYALFVVTLAIVGSCLHKRRALGKLLVRRNEIAGVDKIQSLGRPALRVRFLEGGSVTLPTWNHDRERVFTLLSHRELPPARLLK